jgi:general secretion pathway protein L
MAQHILGLDIDDGAVRAVLLESTYRGYVVRDARQAPVPAPLEGDATPLRERQGEAIKALLGGVAFDTAIVALPGASALHHVSLPFSDLRRIEQTVGFEVEAQIPFDLAEVAWDWQPLQLSESKGELLVAVAKREELSGLLASLAGAGVDPRAVLPPGPAYASLFDLGAVAGGADAPIAQAVLDVGSSRASVCVAVRGACEAARTFPVARPPSPDLPHHGEGGAGAGAIARELRATFRAWRARSGPEAPPLGRLLLAGRAPEMKGLAALLAAEVEGPVEPLALQAGPATAAIGADDAPGYALALGLALRGHLGSRAPRMNLRRGDLAYVRDFQHLRGKVARLGAWAAAVLVLAMASSGVKSFALSRQDALLDKALCEATQKLVGKCYENDELAVAALRGKGTVAAAVPRNSAVDVLAELAARTPQDVHLRFDRMEITRDKLHLQGTTGAAEDVDKIVSGLRGSRCFGDARSGGARKRGSDGKFEFTIDSDLTCDTGEKGS